MILHRGSVTPFSYPIEEPIAPGRAPTQTPKTKNPTQELIIRNFVIKEKEKEKAKAP